MTKLQSEPAVFPDNFPLPKEYLLELGRIATLWGALEAQVETVIQELSGICDENRWRVGTIITHSSFQQKLDIIETLCCELKNEHKNIAKYKEVLSGVKEVQQRRNLLAHNSIAINEETGIGEIYRMTARGKLKIKHSEIGHEYLVDVSKSIHISMLDLHELITGVRISPIWER